MKIKEISGVYGGWAGVTGEEIAEMILVTRFARASTTFASAIEGMDYLVAEKEKK